VSGLAAGLVGIAALGTAVVGGAGSGHHDAAPTATTVQAPTETIVAHTEPSTVCVSSPPETTQLVVTLTAPNSSAPSELEAQVSFNDIPFGTETLIGLGRAGDQYRYVGTLGPFPRPGVATWRVNAGGGASGSVPVDDC
jgi:hypothetical protein